MAPPVLEYSSAMDPAIPYLLILDLEEADLRLRDPIRYEYSAVISLGSPGKRRPRDLHLFQEPVLRLEFDDVEVEHGNHPTRKHVRKLIKFCRQIPSEGTVLIHCHAGISRSTAAAMILIAIKLGPGREGEIPSYLNKYRPVARPNRLMVRYADDLLQRGGNLNQALNSWEFTWRASKHLW